MQATNILLLAVAVATLSVLLHAHGVMNVPPQRGCLRGETDFCNKMYAEDAPTDWNMHFPAGSKEFSPGAGANSQRAAAGAAGWTPFTPLEPSFKWRAGVCGDLKSKPEHMRGGEYYYDGMVSMTYKQGSVIDLDMSIVGFHNGFVEFHVCDVSKCDGEISEDCFRTPGACKQLQREWTADCENGANRRCGPIDKKYPGRWYLPCAKYPNEDQVETFGEKSIRYRLPEFMHCDHCVLQWYWATANACNPPGLEDYFNGPNKPIGWGSCEGESGAEGGYASHLSECGGSSLAEEYMQCGDIRIERSESQGNRAPTTAPMRVTEKSKAEATTTATTTPMTSTKMVTTTTYTKPTTDSSERTRKQPWTAMKGKRKHMNCGKYNIREGRRGGYGGIRDIVLIADGCRILSLNEQSVVDISMYKWVAIEAVTEPGVSEVGFSINGGSESFDRYRPFMLESGRWNNPIVNRPFSLQLAANGDTDTISITLIR